MKEVDSDRIHVYNKKWNRFVISSSLSDRI
jgi:hypothetical protein